MNKTLAVIGGIGAGAVAMYFLDPDRGPRRRALVRDKAVELSNDARRAVTGKAADLRNRAQGMFHEAKGLLKPAAADLEPKSSSQNTAVRGAFNANS